NFDPAGSAAAVQDNLNAHTTNRQNPHGVTAVQVGAYDKNQSLTSATAQLFGLDVSAVPDAVFNKIKTLIDSVVNNANSRASIISGSYVGDGQSTRSISFPTAPKCVFINSDGNDVQDMISWMSGLTYAYLYGNGRYRIAFHIQSNIFSITNDGD